MNNKNLPFLLQEINKQLIKTTLLEGEWDEDLHNQHFDDTKTLSRDEVSQLVQMIIQRINTTSGDLRDMNAVADFAYDLIDDIPGLEDEDAAHQAVIRVINAYKKTTIR